MTIRILIADDLMVIRQGLHMFLSMDPEIEIVGDAANGIEALEMARRLRPAVVVMDLLMPHDGFSATEAIRKELPEVEVVALTGVLDEVSVVKAITAGAIAYILKDTNTIDLRNAIHSAAAGKVQLPPKAAERLLAEVRLNVTIGKLRAHEVNVIRLIAGGKSNKEIASLLHIRETAVKERVRRLLLKLNLASRTQAALYAVQIGLASFL
jgi:two-component system, NarL family, response regulator LiaR